MTTSGTFDYVCFAQGDATEVGNELGIARHASSDHAFLEAALVRFAPGERIVDAQFYRDARLLVLLNDSSGNARLDMLNCELLSYTRADAADGDTVTAGRFCLPALHRPVALTPARLRRSLPKLRRSRHKCHI